MNRKQFVKSLVLGGVALPTIANAFARNSRGSRKGNQVLYYKVPTPIFELNTQYTLDGVTANSSRNVMIYGAHFPEYNMKTFIESRIENNVLFLYDAKHIDRGLKQKELYVRYAIIPKEENKTFSVSGGVACYEYNYINEDGEVIS